MLSARESRSRNPISQPKSRPPAARSNRLAKPFPAQPAPKRAGSRGTGKRFAMAEPVYRRVVVKLSGEYLAGSHGFGIDQPTVDRVAGDLIAARQLGSEVAVVVGGGNIVRGVEVSSRGVSRPTGDTMGMLATMMNCLALEAAIERRGAPARSLSAFVMPQICELFTRGATHKYLAEGRIVQLGGGIVDPYLPNDTIAYILDTDNGW